jgi:hypothetical protein
MTRWLLSVLTLTLILSGCKDESVDTIPPETYWGQYMVRDLHVVGSKSDSVILYIEDGSNYRMTFFPDTGTLTDFCDVAGVVADWPKNRIVFRPSSIQSLPSCDSARIPRGEFEAVFAGDSLTCLQETPDSLYRLDLLR